jgi:hypothetical protein
VNEGGAAGRSPSISRFLRVAGVLPVSVLLLYGFLTLFAMAEKLLSGRAETAVYFFLFLLPIGAGTGLLTIAREGRLDLLFGAGVARRQTAIVTLLLTVVIPVAVLLLISVFLDGASFARIPRMAAIAAFTGGIGFAAGMVRPRYAAGVVWFASRLAFLLSPGGVEIFTQMRTSAELPLARYPKTTLAALAIPEFLLEPGVPPLFPVAAALIGLAAVFISIGRFERADFGGKRLA